MILRPWRQLRLAREAIAKERRRTERALLQSAVTKREVVSEALLDARRAALQFALDALDTRYL